MFTATDRYIDETYPWSNSIFKEKPQEEINLCATPVFAPISLTGQDVIITIQFQSNDPLDTPNSFSADVECQSV